MEKKVKNKIEYAFYNYEKLLKLSAQEVVDLAYKNIAVRYDKPSVISSVGKTMQDKICDLIDKTSENYRWAMVVEKTLEHFAWDYKSNVIKAKYFNRKRKYEICSFVGISERTYDYWINDILTIAERWAIELGVITNEKV